MKSNLAIVSVTVVFAVPAETRPLLLATAGREPSDPATLRGHGAADRFAVHASGVGGAADRADFSEQGGRGGKSVRRKGRRRALGFYGGTKLAVPWPVEAPGTANPTDNCVERKSGVFSRSGRRPIMEIPG